jgi:NAD(P)-dependent dehydrogenase (short-subunit alcohol dehydrogenase family)
MTQEEIAVVTGSSTGIGFETSLTLARNGFHTYAIMR